jgi:hypothetical protein
MVRKNARRCAGMAVTVISDDQYFLTGVLPLLATQGVRGDGLSWRAFAGLDRRRSRPDALVVDVGCFPAGWRMDALIRRRVPALLVVDMDLSLLCHKRLFFSKKEGGVALLRRLRRMTRTEKPACPARGLKSLQRFNAGMSISHIACELERSEVSIYRLKSEVVVRSGFARYHPQAGRVSEWLWALEAVSGLHGDGGTGVSRRQVR